MTAGQRTRVKICGVTRAADAQHAVQHGADAIGLIFAKSPRRIDQQAATEVLRALPPFASSVGVFADQSIEFIRDTMNRCGLAWTQLSGKEPPEVARALQGPVIKTVHVVTAQDLERHADYPAQGFLLDTPSDGPQMGGTGKAFDWQAARELPWDRGRVIVAGGLTPDNVGAVIEELHPAAVDVSSGVEVEPGIKDPEKVAAFLAAVTEADARRRGEGKG